MVRKVMKIIEREEVNIFFKMEEQRKKVETRENTENNERTQNAGMGKTEHEINVDDQEADKTQQQRARM